MLLSRTYKSTKPTFSPRRLLKERNDGRRFKFYALKIKISETERLKINKFNFAFNYHRIIASHY